MNRIIMRNIINYFLPIPALVLIGASAQASSLTIPHTFQPRPPTQGAAINANFTAVKTAVDDNHARIAQLEAQVANLQSFITQLQQAMSLQTDTQGHAAVVFSGVNVHINNGAGSSQTANGLGNLIVGYDEIRPLQLPDAPATNPICSDGDYAFDQTACEANGGVWAISHKSGSHNLIVGPYHNYSQYGGLVAGHHNSVIGLNATVSAGTGSTASGRFSNVSGGVWNMAIGFLSNVSGGINNAANGILSSVSGGAFNVASGAHSSVSGGTRNTASGTQSSISGGRSNTASGLASSVSGGSGRTAANGDNWVAGSLLEAN